MPSTSSSSAAGAGILTSLLPFVSNHNRLLERLDELARQVFDSDAGFVARLEHGPSGPLHVAARHGRELAAPTMPDLLPASELISPWQLDATPLIIDDLRTTPLQIASFLTEQGLRSLLALPLNGISDENEAVLLVASRKPGAFATVAADDLASFRREVGLSLGAAGEFRRQQELATAALKLSRQLWHTVREENGYNRVVQLLVDKALQFSGADAASLMVVVPESSEIYVRAARGIANDSTADVQVPWGSRSALPLTSVAADLPLLDTADSGAASFRRFAQVHGFATYCGLPLQLADDQPALGLMNLYWRAPLAALEPETARLLDVLAHAGAEILEYSRVHEALHTYRLVQEQFNEHKTMLLSLISHQLRTPLTSLKGFSQLMVRRANNGQPIGDERHAQTMLTEANRLAIMLDNLLELSRLERALLEIERRPLDVAAFVDDLRNDSFVASLIENGLLNWSLPAGLPNPVGDALRLRQALLSVLRRARTRSPENSPIKLIVQVPQHNNGHAPHMLELVAWSAEEAGELGDGDPLALIDLRNVVERQTATQDELALYSAILLMRGMGGDLRMRPDIDGKTEYVMSLPAATSGD